MNNTPFWMKKPATPVVAPPMCGKTSMLPIGPAVTQAEAEAADEVVTEAEVLPAEALAPLSVTGLARTTAAQLKTAFRTAYGNASDLLAEAAEIRVTDSSQAADMSRAREIRLKIRAVRCAVENVRKDQKADSLLRGKVIDGVANAIKGMLEPAEDWLLEQEEFAKRQEEKRINDLREERRRALAPYLDPAAPPTSVDLAYLSPDAWDALLEGSKLQAQHRAELAKQEEQARREREEADRAERKRLADENERLRKEQAEKDAENKRLKDEAEKAERDRKAREAAEQAEKARQDEARRKAEAAPDREKVLAYVAALRAVETPILSSEKGREFKTGLVMVAARFFAELESLANAKL